MTAKKEKRGGVRAGAGAKAKPVPADAAEQIEKLSAHGWSVIGISKALGTSPDTLNKWLAEDEALRNAMANGREQEHQILWNVLMRSAMNGNVTAAIMLLNARHGYRTDQGEQGNKVSITFNLPGAMPMADFLNATAPQIEKDAK